MQNCPQTETQSVWEHGISVKNHIFELITFLETDIISDQWRLPDWIYKYQKEILESLLSKDIIEEYCTLHDLGKPYCIIYDENGKRHFPNHAEVSAATYLQISNNIQVAKLISMDMVIHTIKANDIDDFIKHPEAITLLLAGLSEIHSNAKMFGGINSDSFKIKYKQILKRGQNICNKLFGEKL
jgi:hypothetical protein